MFTGKHTRTVTLHFFGVLRPSDQTPRVNCPRGEADLAPGLYPPYQEYRSITWVNRMNPPCDTIVPNAVLPCTVFIWLPRNCTRLNRLTISILNWTVLPLLNATFFATDRSVWV